MMDHSQWIFIRWGYEVNRSWKWGLKAAEEKNISLHPLAFLHASASLSISWPAVMWLIKNGPSSGTGILEKNRSMFFGISSSYSFLLWISCTPLFLIFFFFYCSVSILLTMCLTLCGAGSTWLFYTNILSTVSYTFTVVVVFNPVLPAHSLWSWWLFSFESTQLTSTWAAVRNKITM